MKSLSRTLNLLAVAATLALAGAAARAADEEKVLNIYNWSDYIADDTVKNFEKETGIKVHYDNFDSNEILHSKLVAGRTGYDIVVPSSSWARLQIQNKLYAPLDKSRLPNLKNVDPAIAAQLARIDPGNAHVVDWLWGFTTIGINVAKVQAALGTLPMPDNAWDLLFKPQYAARLKSCGVSFLDSGDEVIPAALHYLGRPIDSADPADYKKALDLLRAVRPSVTLFSSSGYINDMANGQVCVALGWSGDINIARRRAVESKTKQDIRVLMPSTGGLLFFDVMAIPVDAPHPGNALKWINYILRPEVDAALTSKVFYANPNPESKRFIAPDIANDHTVFPTTTEIAGMVGVADALSPDVRRQRTRTFTSFKTER
ncbi:MAG: extracellular solute-binding protein [Caulobacter sp.]|nr:extracellular solute-binding protein [Vitreoscilla sp.]